MADIEEGRRALIARLVDGGGQATQEQRRAAFAGGGAPLGGALAALVDKVARRAHRVTDEDVAAVRAAGLSQDQVFELVVCAAVGEVARQYDGARAALAAAVDEDKGQV